MRSSHECWDGSGYPDGLAGDAIPLGSRVVAVCDAFDAMTTDRPYRDRVAEPKALMELRRCAGTQFDPARRGRAAGGLRARVALHRPPRHPGVVRGLEPPPRAS